MFGVGLQRRTWCARWLQRTGALLLFFVALCCPHKNSAVAENKKLAPVPWREMWTGADVTSNTWLIYSGVTIAPFSHIHEDGLRFRFATGYGQYSYSGNRRFPGPTGRPVVRHTHFDAETSFAEFLIGYLKRFGELTAKVFIGAAYISHTIGPFDSENEVQSDALGAKGGVELWLNLGEHAWTSLDSFYTTAHDTFSVRSRFGFRVLPMLSLGPEAAINGNAEHINGRAGLFARCEYLGGELSGSAGVSGDIAEPANPYATLNWMSRF